MTQIAYLGPEGTFTHEVALGWTRSESLTRIVPFDLVPLSTKLDVLESVSKAQFELGVVPIENSIEGSVSETLDGLLRYENLYIVTEIVLPISQNLMGNPGTTVAGLREVWSHPQGIAQCRSWIHQQSLQTTQFSSTAAAAKAVRDSGRTDVGAIANRAAAEVFGLSILHPNLQDEKENHTRFVVVSNRIPVEDRLATKTMLLLTPSEEHSGVLAAILNVLAALSLNLTWIESRPTKRKLGTYQFFLDIESGIHETNLQKALDILRVLGHEIRLLGSYGSMHL